jgi:hypothetical protein
MQDMETMLERARRAARNVGYNPYNNVQTLAMSYRKVWISEANRERFKTVETEEVTFTFWLKG